MLEKVDNNTIKLNNKVFTLLDRLVPGPPEGEKPVVEPQGETSKGEGSEAT